LNDLRAGGYGHSKEDSDSREESGWPGSRVRALRGIRVRDAFFFRVTLPPSPKRSAEAISLVQIDDHQGIKVRFYRVLWSYQSCKGSTFCPPYRPNITPLSIHLSPFTTLVQAPAYSPTLRYIFAYCKTHPKSLTAKQQGIFAM
jgi:hypothetical protein